MTGGLINIISYGVDDLFLTGAPEITLFKIVYRRYTNFSKESFEIPLNDIDFDKTVEIEIPKVGDLISNTYLQLNIPAIQIQKIDTIVDATEEELNILQNTNIIENPSYINNDGDLIEINYEEDYNLIKRYMNVNMAGYRKALKDKNIKNQTVIQYMNSIIDTIQAAAIEPEIIQNYELILNNVFGYEISQKKYEFASFLDYRFSDLTFILNTILDNISNTELLVYGFIDPNILTVTNILTVIEGAINTCQKVMNYYFNIVKERREKQLELNSQYAKFAWVNKLGHSIIDYIEIKIGGEIIDKHYGDWINIWSELTISGDQQQLYKKMIGEVKELITFNREKKPQYSLYIPLSFWFSKQNGQAFPIISLQYNKFYIAIKLKKLEDCAYIEKLPIEDQEGNPVDFSDNTLALTDIWNNLNLNISGNLLIDYVYLESQERKRFAQSAHEYLIETVELTCINNVIDNKEIVKVNFTGPSKELIYVCQKNAYIDNFTTDENKSNLKSLWFNYSTDILDRGLNPIHKSKLLFSGDNRRFIAEDRNHMNYLKAWMHHTSTPSNGINIFSFALSPEEHQPSGSCNFTRIQDSKLVLNIDDDMFFYNKSDVDPSIIFGSPEDEKLETAINIRVYSIKYNILRIMHGYAAKAFK
jgi:ribosomal protein S8